MTKVHLVTGGRVVPVKTELDMEGDIPIRPLPGAAVLQLLAPPTTDEWPIPRLPGRSKSFALHPDLARELGQALLDAARNLEDQS